MNAIGKNVLGTLFALICGAPIVVNAGPVLRAVDSIAVGMKVIHSSHCCAHF